MSKFGGDMFSKVADAAKAAGQAAMQKAHQAAHYAAEATEQAKRYASEATEHAKRQAQAATAGGFASVYLASLPDGNKVVVKKMFAGNAETQAQLVNEVKLMSGFSHPGIVKVHASESRREGRDGLEILVVMEFCPGGHLLARINKQADTGRPLPYEKVLDVFLSIVKPVAYLHALTPPITHRDLKFENVLIAADGSLRLCDFGSASTHAGIVTDRGDRAREEDAITRFTTPHFRSPEMVDLYSGLPLDERGDVWALGCMLYGLAYFKHPFQETGVLAILAGRYRIPYAPAYPLPVTTMIRACLQVKPQDRPTAAQLIAYIEACQKAPAAGPWPALQLSGGGSVGCSPLPPPPPPPTLYDGTLGPQLTYYEVVGTAISSSVAMGLGDFAGAEGSGFAGPAGAEAGFGGAVAGSASATDGSTAGHGGRRSAAGASFDAAAGAAGASSSPADAAGLGSGAAMRKPKPAAPHHETAADIAAKIAAASAAAAPSSSLQARLARRGGAAAPVAAATAPAPALVSPVAATAAGAGSAASAGSRRPSGAAAAAAGSSVSAASAPSGGNSSADDFGLFDAAPASSPSGSHASTGSGFHAAAAGPGGVAGAGGFGDFSFDAFGASSSSASASGAPAAAPSAARRPSGDDGDLGFDGPGGPGASMSPAGGDFHPGAHGGGAPAGGFEDAFAVMGLASPPPAASAHGRATSASASATSSSHGRGPSGASGPSAGTAQQQQPRQSASNPFGAPASGNSAADLLGDLFGPSPAALGGHAGSVSSVSPAGFNGGDSVGFGQPHQLQQHGYGASGVTLAGAGATPAQGGAAAAAPKPADPLADLFSAF